MWRTGFTVCVAAAFLVAAAFAGENKPVQLVKTSQKLVALTFDDGPDTGTKEILELFKKEGVKGTFFVKGASVEKFPDIAKAIVAAGCEIGNHTWSHPNLSKGPDGQAREEIVKTQAMVKQVCGVEPRVFRAPYLAFDARVWQVLDELKMPGINASTYTGDSDKAITPEKILERVQAKPAPGTIVLMHSWQDKTRAVLPQIIRFYKDNGFQFVTVSELLAAEGK